MLEHRWRQIVRHHGPRMAVYDSKSGHSWSFDALAALADSHPPSSEKGLCFPAGRDLSFLLEVLRAWKTKTPICPLESNQAKPDIPLPPADLSLLKITSGSTGHPRMVAMTQEQMAADADQIVTTMGLTPEIPNLGVISLAHSYGFSNLVLPLLLQGIPLILAESPLPESVWKAALPWSQLTLPAVPALWRAWHEAGSIPRNISIAISAGAALPLELETAVLHSNGLKIHNFLGASECGGIAYDRSSELRPDSTFIGTALDGVQLSSDEAGCLVVSGPAVGSTYWPNPEPGLSHGIYTSADLISIDLHGHLRIQGRASDLINVAGRKVAPERIERMLLQHPDVRDCLSFGIPDTSGRGESVGIAYSVRRQVSEANLREFLSVRLSGWEIPRRWWLQEDLATDGRGKRSRVIWRDRLLATQ